MDHIAIMNPRWKLIEKILNWEKTIESRWYIHRSSPWNRVSVGDTIYFKDAGKNVTAKAQTERILQFENLNDETVCQIIENYGKSIALIEKDPAKWFHKQKYCILIFLKNPEPIDPFPIDKTGFGMASAWMTVGDINQVKKT